MALELLAVLTALGVLGGKKRDAGKAGPGPAFPADNTAVTFPAPGNVVVPTSSSPGVPPSPGSPATVPISVQPAQPSSPPPAGKGVAPGTPEPGWTPYSPPPAPVVSRARQVLSSGALRVTEGDPTGRFSRVRYRRERNPTTGSVSVTAWRPAGAVANA
jgi:hypothetical protein